MKKIYFTIYFFTLFCVTTFAQISGTVSDKKGEKIPFANVVLLQNDTIILTGTITDENGKFEFANSQNANLIKISCIGYSDFSKKITANETIINAVLTENDVNLQEITVSARRQLTQIKNGAMVTTVENSLLSKEGNAEDVLKKIPGVIKKGDKIEVFGRGTPEIYINGKKVQDESELKNLNSESIKNVQVITNPGVKYSAETKSVIVITTKNTGGEGFSFDVKNTNKFSNYYSTNNALNLNYRKNKLDVFANVVINKNKIEEKGEVQRTSYADEIWTYFTATEHTSKESQYNGKIGFDYQINAKNSLGAYFQSEISQDKISGTSLHDVLQNDIPYDEINMSDIENSKLKPKQNVNFYYIGQAGKLDINVNFDFMSSFKTKDNSVFENSSDFGNRNVNTYSESDKQLLAEKIVLSYPVLNGTLNFGNEHTDSKVKENYKNDEGYIDNSDLRVEENNNAIFMEYSRPFNGVNISAGLRYENIGFEYYSFEEKTDGKTYNNFFPSFSVSAPIKDFNLSFSYSQRTRRPAYYQLSSGINYSSRYLIRSGNPLLKPTKSHDFQFMTIYKIAYLQAFFSIIKNPVLNTTKNYAEDSKIEHVTFENFDKMQIYQIFAGCQPSAGLWSATINAGVIGHYLKIRYREQEKIMNNPLPIIQFFNKLKLPKGFVLGADFDFTGKGQYENVALKTQFNSNISIQKSFFNDALDVKLSIDDIFKTNNQKLDFYNADIFIYQADKSDTRFATLTLKYRFNPAKSKYKGTGAGNDEKQRM